MNKSSSWNNKLNLKTNLNLLNQKSINFHKYIYDKIILSNKYLNKDKLDENLDDNKKTKHL